MQPFFEKVKNLFSLGYDALSVLLSKGWLYIKHRYQLIDQYYKSHPKQKKWSIVAACIFGPPLLFLFVVWIEIPSRNALRNIRNQLPSEVYSADSVLLGRYYIQDRTEVPYEKIAPIAIQALIATEDVRFYEHGGIDYESLGRVFVRSIMMGDESSGGGSTITQQLSKNLFPRKRYWVLSMLLNKMREMTTAIRIENLYSKEEILAMYLNTVSFADQSFGIESASKRFFSTTARELRPEQAALLVGMLKATHSYNPRLFPERAIKRRNVVIAQMLKYNFINIQKADSLEALPIALKYSKQNNSDQLAPYFREYLRMELQQWFNQHPNEDGDVYNIYTDGLKIYTTIDSKLQAYAEKAVTQQMTELQKQFFAHWGKEGLFKENETLLTDALKRTNRYKRLKDQELTDDQIMVELNKRIPMRLFSWQDDKEVVASPVDSVKHHVQFLNAGFMAMHPTTGNVLAWVGGIDHDFFQYDHVRTSTKRQVGSIFKPLVYAMAIEQGVTPCELTLANRETYIDKEGEEWTPRNSQNDYEVKYSMRGALAYSVNTVAVKMILKAGVENTMKLAKAMGIESELPDVPSIALGSSSISLLEMTSAYTTFANEGKPTKPVIVTTIIDTKGRNFKPLQNKVVKQEPVLSERSLKLTREMLRTVVHEGTASRIRWRYGVLNDLAGKTGTTQGNADGWFMAIMPELVVGSWVGADDQRVRFRTTELGQGASTALPITGYFMKQVNSDENYKWITDAKFPTLPAVLQQELACDLYELDSALMDRIARTTLKRDSLLIADTTAIQSETFLEQLYKRKMKLKRASEKRDSVRRRDLIDIEEIEN